MFIGPARAHDLWTKEHTDSLATLRDTGGVRVRGLTGRLCILRRERRR